MFRNVAYHFKIPISFSLVILLTGVMVTAVLVWRSYEDVREDVFQNAVEVGAALSNTLREALKHDDVWQAYRLLVDTGDAAGRDEKLMLMVLDRSHRVFASNRPKQFSLLSTLASHGPEFTRLQQIINKSGMNDAFPVEQQEAPWIFVVRPIRDDDVVLGVLLIGYAHSLFLPRYFQIARHVTLTSLLVMMFLLPLGWYMGKSMAHPLVRLSDCMALVGQVPPDEIECSLDDGADEVGKLSERFREMLDDMRAKQQLERQVLLSERLAAVGRMSAGIAHEINNPLGGMINAINTFKQHRGGEGVLDKTLSLLERGLGQIRETVSALLVESNPESHPLKPQDIEDVRTLLHADIQEKGIILEWKNHLKKRTPLPSTQIRQVLINLCLNAIQAAPNGSTVSCEVRPLQEHLAVRVENEGGELGEESMELLFEPFAHHNPGGLGLGLWVTYQIVQQLGGEIVVENENGMVVFTLAFPMESG